MTADKGSSDRSVYFVEQLISTHQKTLEVLENIEFTTQTEKDAEGKVIQSKTATLSAENRRSVDSEIHELNKVCDLVLAGLAREDEESQESFLKLQNLFKTYIGFERVGHDISDTSWKKAFVIESTRVVNSLCSIIRDGRRAFILHAHTLAHSYEDFELWFSTNNDDSYSIQARSSLGEASGQFIKPLSEKDFEIFLLKHFQPRSVHTRSWVPENFRPLAKFGQQLFDATVKGPIRDLFFQAREASRNEKKGLRIRLRLSQAADLASIPWELLHDGRDFLCLSQMTPITRYVDVPSPANISDVEPPYRILVTISSPRGVQALDTVAEEKKIRASLGTLIAHEVVSLQFTEDGTMRCLQRTLRERHESGKPFNVWHFIGHGYFDETEGTSKLLFEDNDGYRRDVSGFHLANLLRDYPSHRLAVLNACEGARTGKDPLAGVAVALVERGIPAVVAMQFPISDAAAIAFAEELYAGLASGLPVDAAVSEGRKAILLDQDSAEWVTPTLFSRSKDGFVLRPLSTKPVNK